MCIRDSIEPITVSVIGCVVNGPGEALISDLGLAGANKRSGFYINGQRQKKRIDNASAAEQMEAEIRQYLANKISVENVD